MSVARWLQKIGASGLALLGIVAGWLLVAPIAFLMPKRRDWIAVIGRQEGLFLDNSKYFFLEAAKSPDLRCIFVTESSETTSRLLASDRESLRYPGLKSAWFLCRCSVAVVDDTNWFRRMRRFLLIRAKVVQLWHGVGCKRIELDRWRHEVGRFAWASNAIWVATRLLAYRATGRWIRYAAVACTSRFYRDEVFRPAFRADHFPLTGYPRNHFALALDSDDHRLAWSNVDASVRTGLADWQSLGRRIVVVTPTFRDSGKAPMQLDEEALLAIDTFADAHGVEFVFKFHPAERNASHVSGRHVHICTADSDIYPLLPHASALVTDYSSISMDFLLVDKPLLFLVPEDDDYTLNDRQLQFDPHAMMPGPVVPNWRSLLTALAEAWKSDSYASERALLRDKAFDNVPQGEAVSKLLTLMRQQNWIKKADPKA